MRKIVIASSFCDDGFIFVFFGVMLSIDFLKLFHEVIGAVLEDNIRGEKYDATANNVQSQKTTRIQNEVYGVIISI